MSGEEGNERPGEKEFLEILSHDVRRRIMELIHDRVEMSYTELLEAMGIGEGTLNFHLRRLTNCLQHTSKGTYILSGHGRLAIKVLHIVRSSLQEKDALRLIQAPRLTADLIVRRIAAYLVDALIFIASTGVFLDPILWGNLQETLAHLSDIVGGHPWLFHTEHLGMIGELTVRVVGVYAHIFFAVYIFATVLEAYKGQTPGKYLLGIRAVKVGGGKVGLLESAIRNAGKAFLLPLDLIVGIIFYHKRGFIRFFDFYTEVAIERVTHVEP